MAKAFRSKGANFLVYGLVGLLILGLAGFGIGNFSSTVQAIGSVGDEEISVQEYAQILQTQINRYQQQTGTAPSLFELQQLGLDQLALRNVVLNASLDNEANQLGVSVGDKTVVDELRQSRQFLDADGEFNVAAYEFALERQGLTAAEFDDIVREEKTRLLLRQAVAGSIPVPDAYVETLMSFLLEKRSFEWADIGLEALLPQISDIGDADVAAYYEGNPDEFTVPETRQITFAWLTPDMIADSASVSEAEARSLYGERLNVYEIPERRAVERLVYSNRAEAESARARIDSGEIDFSELVVEKGLTLDDVGLGTVERSELAESAAEAVFALQEPGIAGPADSEFGPALYNVVGILNARTTPFEDAREDLAEELALESARNQILESLEDFEDRLAAGATLEELSRETDLRIGSIDYNSESDDEITRYPEFRTVADSVEDSDFPELREFSGGGVFALRLDGIIPPKLRPLPEVRLEAEEAARLESARKLAVESAERSKTELEAGKSFEELELASSIVDGAGRGTFQAGVPFGLIREVFMLGEREIAVFEHASGVAIARLDAIEEFDLNSADAGDARESLSLEADQDLGLNVFHIYADAIRFEAGMSLDQSIIDAVHAQLQ